MYKKKKTLSLEGNYAFCECLFQLGMLRKISLFPGILKLLDSFYLVH